MRWGEGQRHSAAPPRAAGTGRGVPRPEPRTGAVPGRPSRPPLPGPKPGPSLSQDITAAEKGPAAAAERGSRSALGAHGTAPRGKGCRAFSRESNRTEPDRTARVLQDTPAPVPHAGPLPSARQNALTEGRRRSRRSPRRSLTLLQGLQRAAIAHQVLFLAVAALRRRHLTRRWPRGARSRHLRRRSRRPRPAPPASETGL